MWTLHCRLSRPRCNCCLCEHDLHMHCSAGGCRGSYPAAVSVQLERRQPPWAGQRGSCGGALQVLVGDPKQLQASSELHNTHVPRSNGGLREFMQHHSRSTMERLSRTPRSAFGAGGANVSALTTQYRMHADVCHVVSEHFYRCGGLWLFVHIPVCWWPVPRPPQPPA